MDLDPLDLIEDTFCDQQSPYRCQREFVDVFEMLMSDNGLRHPENVIEAETIYLTLLTLLQGVF